MNKNSFRKELYELKEANTRVENYLDIFYEKYNVKQKIRDEQKLLLTEMASDFLEKKYRLTDVYKFLANKKCEIEDRLIATFTKEQNELFEIWEFITNEIMLDMEEQGFIYGYIIAQQIKEEIKENN